jgi:hypothetical protein
VAHRQRSEHSRDGPSVALTVAFIRHGPVCLLAAREGTARFNDDTSELPIVGGTGAYAGARGTVKTTKPIKGYDTADVITING